MREFVTIFPPFPLWNRVITSSLCGNAPIKVSGGRERKGERENIIEIFWAPQREGESGVSGIKNKGQKKIIWGKEINREKGNFSLWEK